MKHGNKYRYDKTVYVRKEDKVIITCPVHGDFIQQAGSHKQGCGCPKCANEASSIKFRLQVKDYIEQCIKVHNNQYDYSKVHQFSNLRDKITIICPLHGKFRQKAYHHKDGHGCPKCKDAVLSELNSSNTEDFIKKAVATHGDKYAYNKVAYINNTSNVTITCKEHGDFIQQPANHLQGKGCPSCAKYGFNQNIPGIMYYLSINNGQAYKIGVTNRTVSERFLVSEIKHISIVQQWYFENGSDALKAETAILRKFKEFKYTGTPLLSSGNTELFYKDILTEIISFQNLCSDLSAKPDSSS